MTKVEIEKIIKRVQSDSDKRMQRYIGVFKEDYDDKFKAIGEQFKSIDQKLGSIENRLDRIESDVDVIKTNLTQKVERYEFDALARRVSVVEKKVLK